MGGIHGDGGSTRGDGEPSSVNFSGTYATARDVSERKRAQALINFQAHHDLLTHLPNRILLKERLDGALIESQRKGTNLAAMFIDLDRFKVVNDTLGQQYGRPAAASGRESTAELFALG